MSTQSNQILFNWIKVGVLLTGKVVNEGRVPGIPSKSLIAVLS